ncbi:hypothetical protein BIZ37_00390 [Photobacterium sp. BZF1]|uniref:hypothetical protein n=1 Tax=Photobacterium sp. BZF1 TaxID=1904457 RepID=UPI00165346A2|nr:hypothetical protein [Photobacterium sp. BZF1]MBC7000996.1 hypothetical protein [Photobacterium sp. BZF1]
MNINEAITAFKKWDKDNKEATGEVVLAKHQELFTLWASSLSTEDALQIVIQAYERLKPSPTKGYAGVQLWQAYRASKQGDDWLPYVNEKNPSELNKSSMAAEMEATRNLFRSKKDRIGVEQSPIIIDLNHLEEELRNLGILGSLVPGAIGSNGESVLEEIHSSSQVITALRQELKVTKTALATAITRAEKAENKLEACQREGVDEMARALDTLKRNPL